MSITESHSLFFSYYANLTPTPAGQSKGIELTSGSYVLNRVSKYFNEVSVHDLAGILLEGKCQGGGLGFIERYTASFGQPDWTLMALKVLNKWCDLSQDKVFGSDLLKVLEEVCPRAAQDFKGELLGSAK